MAAAPGWHLLHDAGHLSPDERRTHAVRIQGFWFEEPAIASHRIGSAPAIAGGEAETQSELTELTGSGCWDLRAGHPEDSCSWFDCLRSGLLLKRLHQRGLCGISHVIVDEAGRCSQSDAGFASE